MYLVRITYQRTFFCFCASHSSRVLLNKLVTKCPPHLRVRSTSTSNLCRCEETHRDSRHVDDVRHVTDEVRKLQGGGAECFSHSRFPTSLSLGVYSISVLGWYLGGGHSADHLKRDAMSVLASVALSILHILYRLVLVFRSVSSRLHKDPRPLLSERSNLPKHLALSIIPNEAADEETNEKYMLDSVEKVAGWCQVVGIRRLTVYDREGMFRASIISYNGSQT